MDLTDPTQLANLGDDEAMSLGGPELLDQRDQARAQVSQATGVEPSTFWSRGKDAAVEMGGDIRDLAAGAGNKLEQLGNAAQPYLGAAGGFAVGGIPGAIVGYKAAGGQEATNDEANAKAAQAHSRQQAGASAFNAAPGAQGQPPTMPQSHTPGISAPSPDGMVKAIGKEGEAGQAAIEADAAKRAEADKMYAEAQHQKSAQEAQANLDHVKRQEDIQRAGAQANDWDRKYKEGKVDPDRLYKNEDGSTNYGKTIGAAIAMAMGAFGAALTKGPNFAMQIIDGAIDRDIEAQKIDLSKTQDIARGKKQDLKDVVAADEHMVDRDTEHRIHALSDAQQNIAQFMSQTTDPEKKAKLMELDAQLGVKKEAVKTHYQEVRADMALKNRALANDEARTAAATGKGNPKAAAKVAAIDRALANLDEVEKKNKSSSTGPDSRGAGETAVGNLRSSLAAVEGQPLSARNEEIYKNKTGDNPASLGGMFRTGKYAEIRADLNRQRQAALSGAVDSGTIEGATPHDEED